MKSPRKLQPYQVILVRQMKREGFRHRFLTKLFGFSLSSLKNLLTHSTYKDIH